jgi:adenylosuccinate lyase
MIKRYALPEMSRLWTDEQKFHKWLEVEIALCDVLAELGQIPAEIPGQIRKKARIKIARIEKLELILRHDVVAFTTHIAEQIGDASRYLHFGLTSTDVVDTGQALILRDAIALIFDEIDQLNGTLRQKAIQYQKIPMIGRTHGIHAEPTTFGLKLLLWYEEMQRNILRLRAARAAVVCGKISGAVGTHAHLSPAIEVQVCRHLGLDYARVSSQVLQRDRHAEFLCTLAIIAASYEKFATEIRHLQRTEVREVCEPFGSGQKGSSAMPHKRNPVTCEQICGLARLVRGYALATLENVALWHERDISHSSVERVVLADACTLVHYMTRKLNWILQNMMVNPQQMRRNLRLTKGLVYSGTLLLELTRKGILREEAYAWVQRCSARVWDKGEDFRESVLEDRNIAKVLSADEIHQAFDLKHALRHVPEIFQRVLGSPAQ